MAKPYPMEAQQDAHVQDQRSAFPTNADILAEIDQQIVNVDAFNLDDIDFDLLNVQHIPDWDAAIGELEEWQPLNVLGELEETHALGPETRPFSLDVGFNASQQANTAIQHENQRHSLEPLNIQPEHEDLPNLQYTHDALTNAIDEAQEPDQLGDWTTMQPEGFTDSLPDASSREAQRMVQQDLEPPQVPRQAEQETREQSLEVLPFMQHIGYKQSKAPVLTEPKVQVPTFPSAQNDKPSQDPGVASTAAVQAFSLAPIPEPILAVEPAPISPPEPAATPEPAPVLVWELGREFTPTPGPAPEHILAHELANMPEPVLELVWELGATFEPAPAPTPAPESSVVPTSAHPLPSRHGLQFRNCNEMIQALNIYNVPHDYQVPQNDATLPQNKTQRAPYIRQLFDAFIDITTCIDRENTHVFVNRWEGIPNNTSSYSQSAVETCCQRLLDIAMDLHTKGPRSLNIFDASKLEQIYRYRGYNFAQRISSICELLKLSKARCEMLLDFESLEISVAMARVLMTQARTNFRHNASRQGAMNVARGANGEEAEEGEEDEEGGADVDAEGESEDEGENDEDTDIDAEGETDNEE